MKQFAELLDRLSYEPGRSNKLRLLTEYFSATPDPERGFALAALTGALSFQYAKPGMIRSLISQRTDSVLFGLSLDYVGDLSETVALMWPAPRPPAAKSPELELRLSEVVAALSSLGKVALPGELARWLDQLDETGRWALLKLVTGELLGSAGEERGRRSRRQRPSGSRADLERLACAVPGIVRVARGPCR